MEAYDKAALARDGWCGHLLSRSLRHAGLPTKQAHQAGPLRRTCAKLNHDRERYRAWHATAWVEDAEVHGIRVRAARGGPPGAQACAQQGCHAFAAGALSGPLMCPRRRAVGGRCRRR